MAHAASSLALQQEARYQESRIPHVTSAKKKGVSECVCVLLLQSSLGKRKNNPNKFDYTKNEIIKCGSSRLAQLEEQLN